MRRSKGQALWVHRDRKTGAKVVLAPGDERPELAAAVLQMVANLHVSGTRPRSGARNTVRLARTRGLAECDCKDCLQCDWQAAKREHAERRQHGARE